MEQDPFKLEAALKNWRQQVRAMGIADETIEELETHLIESAESLKADGLSEEESFHLAVSRLGEMGELAQPHPPELSRSAGNVPRAGFVLIGVGGALIVCWLLSWVSVYMLPTLYSAQATIQVGRSGDGGDSEMPTPASLTSETSLRKVVVDLKLARQWDTDEEEALQRLGERVNASPVRGTDLIQVQAVDPDPAVAPKLANAIVRCLQTDMRGQQQKVVIHELAVEDSSRSAARPHRGVMLIGVLSGVLGGVLAMVGVILVIVQLANRRA